MLIKFFFIAFSFSLFTNANFTGRSLDMLMTLFSGHFSNAENVKWLTNPEPTNIFGSSVLELRFTALKIPALSEELCMLLDDFVDNVLTRQEIIVFNEQGDHVTFQHYYLNNTEKVIPGTLIYSHMEKLTYNDLWTTQCSGFFVREDETLFLGHFPDCNDEGESSNVYFTTYNCFSFTAISAKDYGKAERSPTRFEKVKNFPVFQMPNYNTYASLCGY